MISYRNSDGVYFVERNPEVRKTPYRLDIGDNSVFYDSRSEAQLAAWMILDTLSEHGTMRLSVRHRQVCRMESGSVMENTRIAWAHNTQNFFVGCDQIAPECAHCYIDRELRKQTEPTTGEKRKPWGEVYRTKTQKNPAKWQKACAAEGVCRRVFTNSLSDFFHVKGDPWRAEAWDIIRDTPNLVWLILTKRPELIKSRLPADWGEGYPNVWLGVSTACNMTLNKMDSLRKIPAVLRFVSCEPLLEDIAPQIDFTGFQWVIAGGESGSSPEYLWDSAADWKKELYTSGRRTMKLEWATALRDKAHAQSAKFFFKQITATRSEQGIDALGQIYHEMPDPPHSRWAEGDVMQTDEKKLVRKLRSALGNTCRLSKTTKDELSSNPTWGPYKVCQGNTVKDSGTLEDLFARVLAHPEKYAA